MNTGLTSPRKFRVIAPLPELGYHFKVIPNRSPLIMLIEDDTAIRETLQQILELENYQVHPCRHGQEALSALDSGVLPDLILLDLMMPVMNGGEFSHEMERNRMELREQIPILLGTAAGELITTIQNRAQGVVKKPIEMDFLLTQVKKYCVNTNSNSTLSS